MKQENETFDATIAELRALTTYASTDQTRLHLASVCFDLEKGRAAATDGHRLIVIDAYKRNKSDNRAQVLVNAQALLGALRGLGAKKTRVKVKCELGAVTIDSGAVKAELPTVNEKFPPIDQVIPSRWRDDGFKAAEVVGFNPCYIRDVGVVADIQTSHGQRPQCSIRFGAGELDPARVDAELQDEGEVTIVVMPMRV